MDIVPARNLPLIAPIPRLCIPVKIGRQLPARSRALRGRPSLCRVPSCRALLRGAALLGRALGELSCARSRTVAAAPAPPSPASASRAHTLLEPVARLGREIPKPFAALEQLAALGRLHVLPTAVEHLPAVAGVPVDLTVSAGIHVPAPPLVDEPLAGGGLPAQCRAAAGTGTRGYPRPLGSAFDPGRFPRPVDVTPTGYVSGLVRARIVGAATKPAEPCGPQTAPARP